LVADGVLTILVIGICRKAEVLYKHTIIPEIFKRSLIFGTKVPFFVTNGNFLPFVTFFVHFVPKLAQGIFL